MLVLADGLQARGIEVAIGARAHGDTWLLDEARRRQIGAFPVSLTRAIDPLALVRLTRQLRALRPDVVHAHMYGMALYGVVAGRLMGARTVSTFHAGNEHEAAGMRRAGLRVALRLADDVCVVSGQMRADLLAHVDPGAVRLHVVPNGMPVRVGDRLAARRALGVDDDTLVFLAVGSQQRLKGHAGLVRALGALPAVPRWRLLVAGREDDGTAELRDARDASPFRDRIDLLGPRSDVPALLAAADIFVMPSLIEGTPLALLEAMHAGLPTVSTLVGGMPSVVDHGAAGDLVPPGDERALGSALSGLLTSAERRQRLGCAARERAARHYSVEAMVSAYLSVYGARVAPH